MRVKRLFRLTMSSLLLIVGLNILPAYSTDVGGIINQDTTWSLENSPYVISETIQIPDSVTLTIEPGVEISAINSDSLNGDIALWGSLIAVGNESNHILFNSVIIQTGYTSNLSRNVNCELEYCEFYDGCPFRDGRWGTKTLSLKNSIIKNPIEIIYLSNSAESVVIENNIFIDVLGIDFNSTGSIINNSFYQRANQSNRLIYSGANDGQIVTLNSFFVNNRIILMVMGPGYLDATNNYWNTTDANLIDSLIYDRTDDLNCMNFIDYLPILNITDPITPIVELPLAYAGEDQNIAEGQLVILNGSDLSVSHIGEKIFLRWEQVDGPEIILSSTDTFNPSFIAPEVSVSGDAISLRLITTNMLNQSSEDEVRINIFDVEADSDNDGVGDYSDNCIGIANPNQSNTDGDSFGDECDGCPLDFAKSDPGICGCGVPDTDSDLDGTPDCNDECPNDPQKTEPGICGCGVSDIDTDSDGTADCNDECPNDPDKTNSGYCGCGQPETDTDGDGTPDCIDYKPLANITSPDSNQTINAGDSVNFQGNVVGGNPPFTYSWNFGGGANNSTLRDPGDVIFEETRAYTVNFTVSDNDGDISSDTVIITVNEESDDDGGGGGGGFCFINSVR